MHIIEIIYIVGAIIALSAGVPQVRQLLVAKASDEFSLSTWCLWLTTQCVTLTYVTTLQNVLMMLVNLAWVAFYAAMVGLIIYYRRPVAVAEVAIVEDELA
ncbi:MAG: hypothetical protein QG649_191 [Patescibacteria group bacterium]|jgi:uncharacterized protein with PQ loop repeat|nr:hypothetical protein [Patescibacteria group bacterium]